MIAGLQNGMPLGAASESSDSGASSPLAPDAVSPAQWLTDRGAGAELSRVDDGHLNVVFQGHLANREDLCRQLGSQHPFALTNAELVSSAYARWGEAGLSRLRGSFALLIWDRLRETVLCA